MIELVLTHAQTLTIMSAVFIVLFCTLVRSSCISLVDPLMLTAISCGFAMGVLHVVREDRPDMAGWSTTFQISYIAMFATIFMLNNLFSRQVGHSAIGRRYRRFFVYWSDHIRTGALYKSFVFLVILAIIFNFYFSYQMIAGGLVGSDRLILRQDNRFVDMAKRDLMTYALFFAGGLLTTGLSRGRKGMLAVLVVVLAFGTIFVGSKSFLISIIFGIAFGYCFIGARKIGIKAFGALAAVGLAAAALITWIWGGTPFRDIIVRLFAAGDAYFYALLEGNLASNFNRYDLVSYIAHPFLRIFGGSAYEYPLGAALAGDLSGDYYSGRGTNALLPLLAAVSSGGSEVAVVVTMALCGFVVWLSRYVTLRWSGRLLRRYPSVAYGIALIGFSVPPIIVLDLGVALQQLIGMTFGLSLLVFAEALRRFSRTRIGAANRMANGLVRSG